jgi:transposase
VAEGKKNASRLGAYLVFVDESGFLLTPSVVKTWAPVGQTPTVRHLDRRDRISAISGISVSPKRRRLNLYFQLHPKNIRQAEARDFLRHLQQHLPGHLIVLWDGGRPHQGRLVRRLCGRSRRLHLVRLPGYAPELNPDEGVWKLAKQKLANGCPRDLDELMRSLLKTLRQIRTNSKNLRACIQHSDLPLF